MDNTDLTTVFESSKKSIIEPVKEESMQEEPTKEEPTIEESMQEEPTIEESMQEEPTKEELIKEEPTKEESIQEEPTVDKKTILAQERIEKIKNEYIQIICRQTDLTEEESRNKLEQNNFNYMKVLNEYFGIEDKNEKKDITTNQQIYGQIRSLMDTGAKKFRMEQERVEQIKKMNEMREKMMKEKNIEIN